ncbi:POC1 centriolar protein A [Blyttiomyces sp. JEL0837]|nr:POC1 centriolar protein A [Blyttiomyces sp. JEL0837]
MKVDENKVERGETSILFKPSIAFTELVVKGLKKIQLPSSQPHFLLIIDGLDEVGLQGDPVRNEFLNLIRYQIDKLPPWIRVFTTSRPEMDIFQTLNGVNFSVLLPHDQNNMQDIQTFVHNQLSTQLIIDEGGDGDGLKQLVDKVTEKTGGVFHYARLACNALTERTYQSWHEAMERSTELDGGLDQIYLQVLERAFIGADDTIIERFRSVLGAVITARVPLHQDSIAQLLGLTIAEVGGVILRVQSILTVGKGIVKILHKSLKDFLSSAERCKKQHFFVNTSTFEYIMATSCLRVMTDELKHNMAALPNDTDQFHPSPTTIISSHLSYACKFWNSHVLASQDSRVFESLSLFSTKSLLFWIEALVLLQLLSNEIGGELRLAAKWVTHVENECLAETKRNGVYSITRNLLDDAARLIWRFYGEITHNPLQIYSIAVPFSPRDTDLYKTYYSDNGKSVSIVGGMHWGPHLHYLHGHTSGVNSVCFSIDGTRLLSGSEDKTVRMWNVATMKELVRFDGHTEGVNSVCFSSNEQMVGSVSWEGDVILWYSNSAQIVGITKINCSTSFLSSFSPDLGLLAFKEFYSTTIEVVDIMRKGSRRYLEGSKDSSTVCFSPYGEFIAAGGSDSLLEIWNATNGHKVKTLNPTSGSETAQRVAKVQYSNDGRFLILVSYDNSKNGWIRVLEVETSVEIFCTQTTDVVTSVCISKLGNKLLSSFNCEKSFCIWDIGGHQPVEKVLTHTYISSCAMSPCDNVAITSSLADDRISVWDLSQAKVSPDRKSKAFDVKISPDGRWDGFNVKISPDGTRAATFSMESHQVVTIWDTASGKAVDNLQCGMELSVRAKDGQKLIVGSDDKSIRIWEVSDNVREEMVLTGHEDEVFSVCFSKEGLLAASASNGDKNVIVWDVVNGVLSKTLSHRDLLAIGKGDAFESVLFLSDGCLAISTMHGNFYFWDLESAAVIKSFRKGDEEFDEAFYRHKTCISPDGKMAVCGLSRRGVEFDLFDLANGPTIRTIRHGHIEVSSIEFNSDHKKLLSVLVEYSDVDVWEWDVNTGKILRAIEAQTKYAPFFV